MTAKKTPKLLPECEAIIDAEPLPDTMILPEDDVGITQTTALRTALQLLIGRYGVKSMIGALAAIYSERVKNVTCDNSKVLFSKTAAQLRSLHEEIM